MSLAQTDLEPPTGCNRGSRRNPTSKRLRADRRSTRL